MPDTVVIIAIAAPVSMPPRVVVSAATILPEALSLKKPSGSIFKKFPSPIRLSAVIKNPTATLPECSKNDVAKLTMAHITVSITIFLIAGPTGALFIKTSIAIIMAISCVTPINACISDIISVIIRVLC